MVFPGKGEEILPGDVDALGKHKVAHVFPGGTDNPFFVGHVVQEIPGGGDEEYPDNNKNDVPESADGGGLVLIPGEDAGEDAGDKGEGQK